MCSLYLKGDVYNFSGNFRSGASPLLFSMKQPENVIPQQVHPGFGSEARILFRLEITAAASRKEEQPLLPE